MSIVQKQKQEIERKLEIEREKKNQLVNLKIVKQLKNSDDNKIKKERDAEIRKEQRNQLISNYFFQQNQRKLYPFADQIGTPITYDEILNFQPKVKQDPEFVNKTFQNNLMKISGNNSEYVRQIMEKLNSNVSVDSIDYLNINWNTVKMFLSTYRGKTLTPESISKLFEHYISKNYFDFSKVTSSGAPQVITDKIEYDASNDPLNEMDSIIQTIIKNVQTLENDDTLDEAAVDQILQNMTMTTDDLRNLSIDDLSEVSSELNNQIQYSSENKQSNNIKSASDLKVYIMKTITDKNGYASENNLDKISMKYYEKTYNNMNKDELQDLYDNLRNHYDIFQDDLVDTNIIKAKLRILRINDPETDPTKMIPSDDILAQLLFQKNYTNLTKKEAIQLLDYVEQNYKSNSILNSPAIAKLDATIQQINDAQQSKLKQ